jgi:hypothetical protein
MANAKHLSILQQGVDAWNAWREKERWITPDLYEANLSGAANLRRANLRGANLRGTNLSVADLNKADLRGADLSWANLSWADLRGANLTWVDLRGADLSGANLSGANLYEANLRGANLRGVANLTWVDLRGADLSGANLRGADLSGANLRGADLSGANLIDADLNGADLTGANLWETQRGGWRIKNVICRVAYWDRDGKEPTEYKEGEFERIFAKKPRIVLLYPGGMSLIDLLALPLRVERLQAQYPGSVLQIRSMQNDAGGASVTLTVEDLAGRDPDAFEQERKCLETELKCVVEERDWLRQCLGPMLPAFYAAVDKALSRPSQVNNIYNPSAPTAIEGPTVIKGDTNIVTGQAGAVGRRSKVSKSTFQQIQAGASIDLPKLAEELGRLHAAMKGEATGTREQDKATVAVADAEEAALKGDGSAALQYLRSAGKWTLGIAEKISVPLAVEVLKRAI